MASESSFDIVSKVDRQLIDNAVNVARKEIVNRYDFRGSNASLELQEETIEVRAEDEYKVNTITDILIQKAIKQGVDPKFFDVGKPEEALGGNTKLVVKIRQGIDKEKAKEINNLIKEMKLKISSQIQADQIRVSGKSKDDLQKVIQNLKAANLDIALNFVNYR